MEKKKEQLYSPYLQDKPISEQVTTAKNKRHDPNLEHKSSVQNKVEIPSEVQTMD